MISSWHRGSVQCCPPGSVQEGHQRPPPKESDTTEKITAYDSGLWDHTSQSMARRLPLQVGLQAGRSGWYPAHTGEKSLPRHADSDLPWQQRPEQTTSRKCPRLGCWQQAHSTDQGRCHPEAPTSVQRRSGTIERRVPHLNRHRSCSCAACTTTCPSCCPRASAVYPGRATGHHCSSNATHFLDQLIGCSTQEEWPLTTVPRPTRSQQGDTARALLIAYHWGNRNTPTWSKAVHYSWCTPWVLAHCTRWRVIAAHHLQHPLWEVSLEEDALWYQFCSWRISHPIHFVGTQWDSCKWEWWIVDHNHTES